MPIGRTPIVGTMTVRDALLNVINEDMEELFSRVDALETGGLSGAAIATEYEAVAGVDNTKAMTPLRTRQALTSLLSGYLTVNAHTKALHDSLRIDADTLDGKHASAFLQHGSVEGINADTLDGYHSTAFYMKGDDIIVSQGKLIDFSGSNAGVFGDKIRLYNTYYGIAVNQNELTLYKPSWAKVTIRNGSYNGPILGDLIHTGNIGELGGYMPLANLVSTPGNHIIKAFRGSYTIAANGVYYGIFGVYIPWGGVTTYELVASSGPTSFIVKIHDSLESINYTEYGPYTVAGGSGMTYINIDSGYTGTVYVSVKNVGGINAPIFYARVKSGNADIMYEAPTIYLASQFA